MTDQCSEISYEGIENYFDMVKLSSDKVYLSSKRCSNQAFSDIKTELYSAGMLALVESWKKFNPSNESNASFRTFAFRRIKGAMLDFLRNEDTVSRATRKILKKVTFDHFDANKMSSNSLTDAELHSVAVKNVILLRYEADPDTEGPHKELQDHTNSFDELIAKETISKILHEYPLTKRERTVLIEHYFNHKNFAEISPMLGVVESRVSQIHRATLKKLLRYVDAEQG